MALFSDSETSSGNTVQAGTLDLRDGVSSTSVSFGNIAPGDSDDGTIRLRNNGSLDGSLDVNVTNVSSTDGGDTSDLPTQSTASSRVFTAVKAFDQNGNGPFDLTDEFGFDDAELTVDLSSDPVVITAELPKALDPASPGGGDNVALAFDADNDGVEDFQIQFQGGATNYVDSSALPSGSRNGNASFPTGYSATISNGGETVRAEVPASDLSSTFGLGAQARYTSVNPPSSGSNLVVNLTPGAGYNAPAIAGTSSFDGNNTKLVNISDASLRDLADVLDVSVYVSNDDVLSNNDTFVTGGKVSRIERDYDVNEPLASGQNKYVVVEYELSPNVGNLAQGDSVSFDLEVELNQEDSQ
jgi:hypothetical protein